MEKPLDDPKQEVRALWKELFELNDLSWDEARNLFGNFRPSDLAGDIDPLSQFLDDRWGSIAEITGVPKAVWQDFWEPKRRLTILKNDLPNEGFPTVGEGAFTTAVEKVLRLRPQKPFFPPDVKCIHEAITAIQTHGGNATDLCAGLLFFSCEENRFEWKKLNLLEFSVEFFKHVLFETEESDESGMNRLLKPLQKTRDWIECSFTPTGLILKIFKPAYSQKGGAGRRGQFHHNMLMGALSSWMKKGKITPRYSLIAEIMTSCFPEDFEPSFGPEHVRQTCNRTLTRKDQIQEIGSFRQRVRDFKGFVAKNQDR